MSGGQIISEQDEIEMGLRWNRCLICGNQYCITILKECPCCKGENDEGHNSSK